MKLLLRDLVSIHTGVYAKPTFFGDAIYLQSSMFNSFGEFQSGIKPNVTIDSGTNKHLLTQGDVLFIAKGANNYAIEYDPSIGQAIASSTFLILRTESVSRALSPGYLAWYLNHPSTQRLLKSQARGSSMPSISKGTLEELVVTVPSLQRQHYINKIRLLRDSERKITQRLEELRELLIQSKLLTAAQQQQQL